MKSFESIVALGQKFIEDNYIVVSLDHFIRIKPFMTVF